jgi:hypothetical protein
LRRNGFQIRESLLQAVDIQLIDREHSDTALRAARTTDKPFATSNGSLRQRRIHDLDQQGITGMWGGNAHLSRKDNSEEGHGILK